MDLADAIRAAAVETNAVVQSVNPACFLDPSPCSDWDVQSLAEHMLLVAGLSLASARKEPFEPEPFDRDTWQDRYAELAADLLDAWAEPGAMEGMTQSGTVEMDARTAAAITLQELVLHGWDLAAAVGYDYEPPAEVSAAVRQIVESGAQRARDLGVFGPPVDAATDDDLDTALAGSGRDPRWSPN
ncbi:MAG: TIGR03086 family metal-binding protein [Acidimicrobiia bacterium]|nr:TIGR03086 family metal-binding protein [Acidimicrobiia bacterium]